MQTGAEDRSLRNVRIDIEEYDISVDSLKEQSTRHNVTDT